MITARRPEQEIRERLDSISVDFQALLTHQDSTAMQQVVMKGTPPPEALLRKIYWEK